MVSTDPAQVIETRLCSDCGETFDFTEGERLFYKDRGLQHRPNRCRLCREVAKMRARGAEPHITTCVECGERCAVPFQPREDKRVLCRACYNAPLAGSQNDTRQE